MKFNSLVAVAALFAGSLAACASADDSDAQVDDSEVTEEDLRTGKTVRLTETDDGASVNITQGQTIAVKLPQNGSSAYEWQVTSVSRALGQPVVSYKLNNPRALGGGGYVTFTWKTNAPLDLSGTHKVKLEYSGPGDRAAAKKFSFTVKVAKRAQ
jgi:predicted secreted protein